MANDDNTLDTGEGETPEEAQNPAAGGDAQAGAASGAQFSPDELEGGTPPAAGKAADINLDLVLEVPVSVSLQVGSTDITIRDLVQLVEGSVVALDRESTEPLDVLVNGTLIAHGEIVVVDESFGVRLTDVVSPAERIRNIN